MNRHILSWLGTACLLLSTTSTFAQGISLGFGPSSQSVAIGLPVSVGVTISELGDLSPPSLSTFDLNITFDPGLLSFNSAVFGDPVLGDQLDVMGLGGNPTFAGIISPGVLNIFELSFDSPDDLNTLQAGNFTLATLVFASIGVGTSALEISVNTLGDAVGDPLSAAVTSGSITVNSSSIPEPAVLPLISVGLMSLACMRRRARKAA